MTYPNPPVSACCDLEQACVFSKALLARSATCELSRRSCEGEEQHVACSSPVARINCGTLAALLHERARFALRLPPPTRPLMHVHALRLQCGGISALRQVVASGEPDVHRIVARAQERHGSLTELPWETVVAALAQWQPRRRAITPD